MTGPGQKFNVVSPMGRRDVLRLAGFGLAAAAVAPLLSGCEVVLRSNYGALLTADANGLRLPTGFTSRVIATTGQTVPGTSFIWHANPDGGVCYPTAGGGWIYVSNSETGSGGGGASMVRFDSSGTIVEARSILSGTSGNCAGGTTPWGTWLSCEETSTGQVWECDPNGINAPVARPAMGRFRHEATVADVPNQRIYLTEDDGSGGLYRFAPTTWGDLSAGTLEVLVETAGVTSWGVVADPDGSPTACRNQVANTKRFNGGEGICLWDDGVCFVTKGDNRVWLLNTSNNAVGAIYDDDTSPTPDLTGADNIEHKVTDKGLIWFVAEDGGNMEIVAVSITGDTNPVCQLTGVSGSEITGPAFSPDGTRLYFSSQRNPGRTYEVTGPWTTGSI